MADKYELISDDKTRQDMQDPRRAINRAMLAEDVTQARRERDARRKLYLQQYDSDPISQAIAAAEFDQKEQERAAAQYQAEYDKVTQQYADPLDQAIAAGTRFMLETDAPAAQKAFADNERLQQIRQQQVESRALETIS